MKGFSWRCLMYHDVLPVAAATGGGPERFAVPLESFETMLDVIEAEGFKGCSIEDALRLGHPRVAISFDDGTRSQFDYAVPALLARNMKATFFVTTDLIGQPGFMGWSELREIASLGMSVQSHTKSHPFLSELDRAELIAELRGSKLALDEELGQDTHQISFPGGDAPRRSLRHLLDECGYRLVAGSRWGSNREGRSFDYRRPLFRCTMRGPNSHAHARYLLGPAISLSVRRSSKELVLNCVRATVGPSRYAHWRRRVLDALRQGADLTEGGS